MLFSNATDPMALDRREQRLAVAAGLLLLTALAYAYMQPALGPPTLWFDDAWVAMSARLDGFAQLWLTTITTHGFSAMLFGWFELVGFSTVKAQALPLMFGLAVGPATYWATRRAWSTGPAPWLAAALAAFAPLTIGYSTRVKQYSLDILLTAILLGLALGASRRPDEHWRRWWSCAAGLGAIALSSATAGFAAVTTLVPTAQRVRTAWPNGWSARRRALAPAAVFLLAAGGWYAAVVRGTVPSGMRDYWSAWFLHPQHPWASVRQAWGGLHTTLEQMMAVSFEVAAVLLLLGIITACVSARPRRANPLDDSARNVRELLVAVTLLPWLISLALATLRLAPWGSGRADSVLLVPFVVAVASVVTRPSIGRAGSVAVALALVGWTVGTTTPSTYPADNVQAVVQQLDDADPILVSAGAAYQYALSSGASVQVLSDDATPTGYRPILPPGERGHLLWSQAPAARHATIRRATQGTCSVWQLTTPPMCSRCVGLVDWRHDDELTTSSLRALGYVRGEAVSAGRYTALRWVRC